MAEARRRIAGAEQVEEVSKELKERNPYFDGTVEHKIEDGVVKEFSILTDNVSDISPVRAFPGLQVLGCSGTGALVDLDPLRGLRLKVLDLNNNTKVTDLRPLVGMPLESLHLWAWSGTDLSPLKGMPLKWLNIGGGSQKLDLTPLAGLPLESLTLNHHQVSDLTPLRNVPLIELICEGTLVSDKPPPRQAGACQPPRRRRPVTESAPSSDLRRRQSMAAFERVDQFHARSRPGIAIAQSRLTTASRIANHAHAFV